MSATPEEEFLALHTAHVPGDDPGPLTEAALAHLATVRPHEEAVAEYLEVQAAVDAGEPYDSARYSELGQEVGVTGMAKAVAAGSLPGGGAVIGGDAVPDSEVDS